MINLLAKQTQSAYDWTNRLVDSIPQEKWDVLPDTVESTISWQVGHLIVSFYYHSVMVIVGHQKDVFPEVPLQVYDKLFTSADPEKSIGKTNPGELRKHLTFLQQKSISVIKSLDESELERELEPTPRSHPIAKTKFDALDWNIKHTMWHCGQIAILKRLVDHRFDFGLFI